MAQLAMVNTTWDDITKTSDIVFTNRDTGKTLIKKGSLLAAPQAITGAYVRVGADQIPTFGAKYMIISLGFTANGSTGINLRLVGGPTVAGGFTTIRNNKEVAADDTTRSAANQVLPAGDIDQLYDFKMLRVQEFTEVQMMADVLGAAGSITRCDIYLVFDN